MKTLLNLHEIWKLFSGVLVIGIRKTNGANVINIFLLLSRQFASWVMIASVIALPVGYIITKDWLENFAYRTTVGLLIFPAAIFLAVAVTMLTISYQAWRTARVNPVESLKYE